MRSWQEDPKYHKEAACLRVKSWKQLENVKMTYMFFSYEKKNKTQLFQISELFYD